MTQTVPEKDHFITANEGNAVAMCTGYHLATGRTGLVYLQVGRDAGRLGFDPLLSALRAQGVGGHRPGLPAGGEGRLAFGV